MTENYSVMTKLKYLIKSEDKLMADEERDEIESFYNRLRFLGAILKDMQEKHHEENDEGENLAMQISYVTYKTAEFLSFFVAEVAKQGTATMIKPIELKVMQFYDKTYQIQLLQDEKSFDEVLSMSIGNRTMVEEEIMVGFDDEVLTIKERLAGRKKQLDFVWIVGMPGLGKTTLGRKLYNDPYLSHYFHILLTDEDKSMSNEKLGEKLYKQLKGKRYLILGSFPKDQEISVQNLIWLWVAEGFIQKIGQRSLEEVAEDYLMDLIQRNLIIVARKRNTYGNEKND
ncbi:hypothetical protein HYC85_023861 [Camellia sinensis]|uniref:NB-ARC domain-containing protein n=1 Tax=Camellia sinensis TaxID=4442 RepID=A0A7J7GFQ2_CAMSI|nr:hypothetical protein HYC85_023861 [Camellia sinensis]